VSTSDGVAAFRGAGSWLDGDLGDVRPMGAEQSNTSIVFGERLVLKVYRRVGAGPNPELELLRFLTERGFEHVPALAGWYEYNGRLIDATLGLAQEFVAGGVDGWELALTDLGSPSPERFEARARALGAVTGALHTALSSDAHDPGFAPEETSAESLGLLTATVDEEIEQMFLELPATEALAPLAGRGQEVRERLGMLTHAGSAGRVIRHHGDFHLGQAMLAGERWVLLDFEGEPARSLIERRRKRSPLRDVAGMLRSFSYAASASRILHGTPAPQGWEARVRAAYLDGYLETVEQSLLPPGRLPTERLLTVFELEKAVYELRYELDNRPDWVDIPVAGILRLLDSDGEGTP
jgi:trehalose synthase-fused probable maltokinase